MLKYYIVYIIIAIMCVGYLFKAGEQLGVQISQKVVERVMSNQE